MSPSRLTVAAVAILALVVSALPAAASDAFQVNRYGPRVGFSIDPDQFTIGGFATFGEFAPHWSLRPSVDMGFGDHVFSLIFNADVAYSFSISSQPDLSPYAGAGLGIGYYNFDVPDVPGVDIDDSTTELGLNLFGGIEKNFGNKIGSLELRIGIDDLPDFKITAGLGFY